MPLTSDCSFTSEQRSRFLLGAENRPSSELWDEFGIASQGPSQRLGMPTWTPSGLPTSSENRAGGREDRRALGLPGNSGLTKIPAPLIVDLRLPQGSVGCVPGGAGGTGAASG